MDLSLRSSAVAALAVTALVVGVSTAQAANLIHVEGVQAEPGEPDLMVRILVDNDAPLWALSFAARLPAGLTLEDVTLEGTQFGPGELAAEYFNPIQGTDYFGAAVLLDLNEPYDWRALPAGTDQYAVGVRLSVGAALECGDELLIDLRNDLGSPRVDAVFSIPDGEPPNSSARSVVPSLQDGAVTVHVEPTITGITPSSGRTEGGTAVTVSGTNFTSSTEVTLGTTPLVNPVVVDSMTITGATPTHAEGSVDVTVSTSCGTALLENAFTYILLVDQPLVLSVSPRWVRTGGGTPITITGENFTAGMTVTVGGVELGSPQFDSDTTFRGTAPAHAAGSVPVMATTAGGSSTLDNAVTYTGAVTITSVTPPTGGGNEDVVIAGTGFTDNVDTSVLFGAQEATGVNVVSPTELTCHAPACESDGPVSVTVSSTGGFATLPDAYTCANIVFRRSDANCDGTSNVADAIKILSYLFSSATVRCVDALDTNDDGTMNIADAIYLLGYLFSSGPLPPPPFPDLGTDPTPDGIGCAESCAP